MDQFNDTTPVIFSLFASNLNNNSIIPKKNNMKISKYTIKQDQTHGTVLCRNGAECICPFQPAIPTQSQMGGLAIMRMPCSTSCTHAEHIIYENTAGEVNEYTITCTGSAITFDIDQDDKVLKLV